MRILVIDSYSIREGHIRFNATVIEALSLSKSISWIGFCGEKHHVDYVSKLLDGKLEPLFEIFPLHGLGAIDRATSKFRKVIVFARIYRDIRNIIKSLNPDRIIFLATDFTLFPLFVHIVQWKTKPYLILHDLYRMKVSVLRRTMWSLAFNKIKCIVLSASIENNFKRIFPGKLVFLCHHHSYEHLFSEDLYHIKTSKIISNDKVIRFFLVGRSADISISSQFLQLLSHKCEEVTKYTRREFEITISSTQKAEQVNKRIRWINRKLNDEDYFKAILESHYVVFPPARDIGYRASGVLMDAITMRTPVLVPKAGQFMDLVNSKHLEFRGGWLYESCDDLGYILLQIAKISVEDYKAMCRYMDYKSREFSVGETAKRLSLILGI